MMNFLILSKKGEDGYLTILYLKEDGGIVTQSLDAVQVGFAQVT